jgi:hypothetical protein
MKNLNRNKLSVFAAMVFLVGHCYTAPVMAEQKDFEVSKSFRKELKKELRSNIENLYRKAQEFEMDSAVETPAVEDTLPEFITRIADVFSGDSRGKNADDVAREAGKIN